jgi:hypothetical protein
MSGPGFVVLPTSEQGRYPAFYACLFKLLLEGLPEGSGIAWHQGCDISAQINHGIRRALRSGRCEWIWIIGDDHTFAPDIVTKLLAHNVSVVSPLVLKRSHPNTSVMYGEDGKAIGLRPEDQGLRQVTASGNAGMLIRRHVLDAVGDPWFEIGGTDRAREDLAFCRKLQERGIPIHVDQDTWMGHITPVEVWPYRHQDGRWNVKYHNNLTMEVL